jgi:hypothetical protein
MSMLLYLLVRFHGNTNGNNNNNNHHYHHHRRTSNSQKGSNCFLPTKHSNYNDAIRLCAEARQIDVAFSLLDEIMHKAKMARTQVTYGSLMTACERVGDVHSLF